jgi:hypothetical protein
MALEINLYELTASLQHCLLGMDGKNEDSREIVKDFGMENVINE